MLRLPRSCRVAEKSNPIGSREPNCAAFQQITTVQQAQLDAPMYSDAINAAAQSSIHLLKLFFSVCRDLVVLRRNLIRSALESQIMLFFEISMGSFAARAVRMASHRAGRTICIGRAGGQCAWLAPAGLGVRIRGLQKLHVQFSYSESAVRAP